jgi:hypothetical protein
MSLSRMLQPLITAGASVLMASAIVGSTGGVMRLMFGDPQHATFTHIDGVSKTWTSDRFARFPMVLHHLQQLRLLGALGNDVLNARIGNLIAQCGRLVHTYDLLEMEVSTDTPAETTARVHFFISKIKSLTRKIVHIMRFIRQMSQRFLILESQHTQLDDVINCLQTEVNRVSHNTDLLYATFRQSNPAAFDAVKAASPSAEADNVNASLVSRPTID